MPPRRSRRRPLRAGGAGADRGARSAGDVRAAGAEAVEPSFASRTFLNISSGPTGRIAASAWLFSLSCFLKERAALAAAHVTAGGRAQLGQALGDLAELEADLLAAQLARLGGLGERDAGAHEQRLDRGHGRLHRVRDLLVGERVDLAQQQRGALRLGQLVDVGEQLAEALAADHPSPVEMPCSAKWMSIESTPIGRGAAQVVERAVARDAVEPGTHVDLALVGEHRVEGGGEDLLQHVLGVLARAEHVPAERQQARLVARAERLEGGVLAAAGERDQALVGLQAQQGRRAAQARDATLECESAETSIRCIHCLIQYPKYTVTRPELRPCGADCRLP